MQECTCKQKFPSLGLTQNSRKGTDWHKHEPLCQGYNSDLTGSVQLEPAGWWRSLRRCQRKILTSRKIPTRITTQFMGSPKGVLLNLLVVAVKLAKKSPVRLAAGVPQANQAQWTRSVEHIPEPGREASSFCRVLSAPSTDKA